ncbi:MAG TPA: cupin domain-containing protein [Patescibacteria group bacterium]|nr:cupin domain-containing protein [Patescibacteria group bacterium]
MKIASKDQAKKLQNGETVVAYEYPLGEKDIDAAYVEVVGKYPVSGSAMNTVCKELAYVLKGSGKIFVEGEEYQLNEGSEVLIEPGEKFSWEGDFTLIISCSPAWYPEQHKRID